MFLPLASVQFRGPVAVVMLKDLLYKKPSVQRLPQTFTYSNWAPLHPRAARRDQDLAGPGSVKLLDSPQTFGAPKRQWKTCVGS